METISNATSKISSVMTTNVCIIAFLIGIMLCIIFIFVYFMNKNACSKEEIVSGINPVSTAYNNELLCNFYIKSSYNSCATGNFVNGWVNLCALDRVIQHGCRVLDFEVYSVNGICAVAASKTVAFTEKGTYNSIPIGNVLKRIRQTAISTGSTKGKINCPNPSDPLFLHFRIKSDSDDVYTQLAKSLASNLGDYILSPEKNIKNYTNTDTSHFANTMKIKDLKSKVIIIVDKSTKSLESNILGEMTHIIGKGPYFHVLSYNDVAFSPDSNIKDFNSYGKMTYCYPTLSVLPTNYSAVVSMKNGVQMSGLCFQNNDVHLKSYNAIFSDAQSAFILKTSTEGKYPPA